MTYHDTSSLTATARVMPRDALRWLNMLPAKDNAAQALTPLEWQVIDLARQDGLSSLEPGRPRSRLVRFLLGPPPPSKTLADARLEALRHLAVHGWHRGYVVPPSAIRQAQDAGFSEAQIGDVLDHIGARKAALRKAMT
ncbi:hypothetical protein J3E64_001197 [Sphingobium sp. OAS761]|uniref:hypothetical protein n=1 Tax=Sphingobium sp. OAS761 TaxID=2817901 RepID=UPI00209E9486|nr:hypothetical protein [Sphingobium sp. OAS761]MCP1469522.1 hypothetical protein [Sphingobium sp. OAS761]